jgi:hypothetical protein
MEVHSGMLLKMMLKPQVDDLRNSEIHGMRDLATSTVGTATPCT